MLDGVNAVVPVRVTGDGGRPVCCVSSGGTVSLLRGEFLGFLEGRFTFGGAVPPLLLLLLLVQGAF